jgi:hypothetical protein
VAFAMFMASVWLLFWDWQRLRPLFFINAIQPLEVASPRLHSNFERTIYLLFFGAGLLVFSVLRGLHVPMPAFYGSLLIMVVSFSIAVVIALVHQIKYR